MIVKLVHGQKQKHLRFMSKEAPFQQSENAKVSAFNIIVVDTAAGDATFSR